MKLIVGLGNPGKQYAQTRHNVGFGVVDEAAHQWDIDLTTEKFHGRFGSGSVDGQRVALLKPSTYMNRSGRSVQAAGRFYKLELTDLIVVSDDLALPVGRLRMRPSGTAGGHNGLQDIIDALSDDEFCRLRIGIGESRGHSTSHVLGRFQDDEEIVMASARRRAVEAIRCWLENGVDLTMTRYNGDSSPA